MIPVEVEEPSMRLLFQEQHNEENIWVELEIKDEIQEMAKIKEEVAKLRASRIYNTKIQPPAFQFDDLIWQVRGEAKNNPQARKLGPNWEGQFKVVSSLGNRAYRLHELDGKVIPRTWNATHLKFYFCWPTYQGAVLFFPT